MRINLKPYAAMKDSGVPWLGEVPKDWQVERLKNRARNVVEQTSTCQTGDLYLALEHVQGWTGRIRVKQNLTFSSQVKRFRPNDVLFGKLRFYLAKVARLAVSGVCVGEFFVIRSFSQALRSEFLENLLRSKHVIDVINGSTFGAKMPRVDWKFVGNLALAYPPPAEQSAIARFLDYTDRRIRRYIRANKKLITLLEEQKQVIIHCAVTRGLDPNVRLKPSGVEWLGDVPEHWEVVALKRVCNLIRDGTHLPPPRVDLGVPLLSVRNIINGQFVMRFDDSLISEANYRVLCQSFDVQDNDVLLAIVGATLGKVAIVRNMPPFHIQRSLAVLRGKHAGLEHRFFAGDRSQQIA